VSPSGRVTARGGTGTGSVADPPITNGAPGYIRRDSWGTRPMTLGTIDPTATVLMLPYRHAISPPAIGSTWMVDVYAPENTPVFVSTSLRAGPYTPTPFGMFYLDPPTSAGLTLVMTQPGHDPAAHVHWLLPNAPTLIGLVLWVQAFAVPPALPPRLSNLLPVTIQ